MVDLWYPNSYDEDIHEYLQIHRQTLIDYFLRQNDLRNIVPPEDPVERALFQWPVNEFGPAFCAVVDELGALMSTKTIRAFHYTRMTDDEVDLLSANGVVLTSVDFLRERVNRQVQAGHLSRRLGDQIVARTALDNPVFGSRSGFCLTALPIPPDDDRVNMLLQHWGGEGAYWAFQTGTEDFVLAALRRIGRPRIIEFQVPISCTFYGEAGAGTATNIIDAYATLLGIQRPLRDLDLTLTAPLPSEAVFMIHTEGEPDFRRFGVRYPTSFVSVDA